jgi:hypothetical protein
VIVDTENEAPLLNVAAVSLYRYRLPPEPP